MDFLITFRHMESSKALKTHAEEKVKKFDKYLIKPIKLSMVLTVDGFRHIAEIILSENNSHFMAKSDSTDMYQSIDEATVKIEKQLKKYKERLKEHHRPV